MDQQKLKHQLFIGKVSEIIGGEKTIQLLKEVEEAIGPHFTLVDIAFQNKYMSLKFIKKRLVEQIKYMADIERSDKPINRKNEILESARGVYEYFNKLHYEYDKKNENIRTKK